VKHPYQYGAPADETELRALGDVVIAALAPTLPTDDVVTTRWIERVSSGVDPRVVRDSQGRVAGGLVNIPQGQWFGGRSVSTGAITAVGVAPEHRGRGAASQLMAGLIRELHQRNVALSCLYPATQPVYRSADYERAGQHYRYRLQLPPVLQRDDGVLRARPMLAEDEPAVRAIYNLNARNSTGWFDRSDWFWQRMILHSHRYRLRSYVFERDGSIEAYISFTHEAEPTRRYDLVLTDLRASTADGWRALLAFISAHQSMAPHAFIRGDGVEQWFSLLREQQGFEVNQRDDWMLRVVDVPRALRDRGYAQHVTAALHLEVTDPLIEANNGRWVLSVANGRATVERGGEGRLALSVRALAPLYTGYLHARALAQLGWCELDEQSADAASSIFSGPAPGMPDVF